MAALVHLFSFPFLEVLFFSLFVLWPVAAEFPAGPGWEWVASMVEMGGKEYGEVAEPLVKMDRNALVYPDITPIEGWALSAKVEPLWQAEGEGTLALVYEEVVTEMPRVVIAFRGRAEGNLIDSCALELLSDNPEDRNETLATWCNATYNASTFDYYTQAVAYTVRVVEAYEASRVLLSGTSMGGMLVDLAVAGVWTNYFIGLPIVGFMSGGRRVTTQALGLSLQGYNTSIIIAANQWDPTIRLNWDDRIGTICLFPTEEPPICSACFADIASLLPPLQPPPPRSLLAYSEICKECASLTHDSLLLLRLMLEGVNPTCYLMDDPFLPESKQQSPSLIVM